MVSTMKDSGHKQIEWSGGKSVEYVSTNGKRRYTLQFKAWVIEQCLRPNVSVAAIALANGLNASLLRKSIVKHQQADAPVPPAPPGGFVPLAVVDEAPRGASQICIELRRGAVAVTWPLAAAPECSAKPATTKR
uniref:Hypothetical ISPpu14 like transposase n=1 Tax=Alcaligenes sp. O-1 TaxID=108557 RepID=Q3LFM1_9BURK|nr:hypothetical ISPpu14 like transposase [Alcaligenes sp. O-1]